MTPKYEAPGIRDIGSLQDLTLGLPIKEVGTPKDAVYPKGFPDFKATGAFSS